MRESLASPNDRLRTVAYSFFEHNPDRAMLPRSCWRRSTRSRPSSSGPRWSARWRPHGDDPRGRSSVLVRESARGEDFFRSAVIEALGDYKAQYAFDALTAIAKLDGPLQDDAALALGQDRRQARARDAGGAAADRAAQTQPAVAAAICLLGVNCESHENYLDRDAEVRRHRTPASRSCCAARPPASARSASPATSRRVEALFDDRHPVARSDARAGRAGARRRSRCATRRSC